MISDAAWALTIFNRLASLAPLSVILHLVVDTGLWTLVYHTDLSEGNMVLHIPSKANTTNLNMSGVCRESPKHRSLMSEQGYCY
jgi:hypothetical protein